MEPFSLADTVSSLAQMGQWLALPLLALSATFEYLFPPFPGDTITIAGAVLAKAGGWSYLGVFASLTLGSVAGSCLAWWVGAKGLPERKLVAWFGGGGKREGGIHRVLDGYRRHGAPFLIINRFMPGIRAFFFVGAGIARIPLGAVAFYSAISAGAWNILLLVAGYFIGDNLDSLQGLFTTYMTVVWILLGAAAVGGLLYWLIRRFRRPAN